jgi:DNA-binding GntR family transcriptional regulator
MMNRLKAVEPSAAASTSRVADAYQTLKAAIRDNVFAPGHQGSEQEIAARLGMSRTPVHEALIRLQEEGLVRVLPKRGVLVCPLTPDDMREVYDLIMAFEGTAAELIAQMDAVPRAKIVDDLTALNRAMQGALARDDRDAWAAADDQFHRALIDQAGNQRLARLANSIMDQSHRARMVTRKLRTRPDRSIADHQALIDALAIGDAVQAQGLARQHRQRARDELMPLLNDLGMRNL